MKHIITASAASLLAISTLAKDTSTPQPTLLDGQAHRMPGTRRGDRLNAAAKASDIIGMTVHNYQDEKLGNVDDLAIDVESGRILQVILSTGGFIGIGDRLTAVPPGALHFDVVKNLLHLNADKEKLKNTPEFDKSKWSTYSDAGHLVEVYRNYGEESAYQFVQTGDDAVKDGRNTDSYRKNSESPTTAKSDRSKPVSVQEHGAGQYHSMMPEARLTMAKKASELIGMQVHNLQDEKLGKVENLLLDLPSGRVVAVVISSGGFLGMGDELSAVPAAALHFTTERTALQLDASKESLASAPHFKADQWPDFTQPAYTDGVYRAYQVTPYFSTNVTTAADATLATPRNRVESPLTPLDQGNSKADIATTANIRKEVMAGKTLSVNAKNVKIITLKGRVTLRGRVDTAEEKRLIRDIADRIAHPENVENQLEVAAVPATTRNN